MNLLKRKPKPFKAMTKGRRVTMAAGLALILAGCLVLISAMQNEEWTQDEPTQRKVFLLAFILLITSIALCYYALNGDEDEKEWLEEEKLTSVKYGDYNSLGRCLIAVHPEKLEISRGMENRLLHILLERNNPEKKECPCNQANGSKDRTKDKTTDVGVCSKGLTDGKSTNLGNIPDIDSPFAGAHETSNDSESESLKKDQKVSPLVALMPLLPLQLCQTDLVLPPPRADPSTLGPPPTFPTRNQRLAPVMYNPFRVDRNVDAG